MKEVLYDSVNVWPFDKIKGVMKMMVKGGVSFYEIAETELGFIAVFRVSERILGVDRENFGFTIDPETYSKLIICEKVEDGVRDEIYSEGYNDPVKGNKYPHHDSLDEIRLRLCTKIFLDEYEKELLKEVNRIFNKTPWARYTSGFWMRKRLTP